MRDTITVKEILEDGSIIMSTGAKLKVGDSFFISPMPFNSCAKSDREINPDVYNRFWDITEEAPEL